MEHVINSTLHSLHLAFVHIQVRQLQTFLPFLNPGSPDFLKWRHVLFSRAEIHYDKIRTSLSMLQTT